MKISELRVDGFGVWKELRLGDLADGLNVFYGPNEAGKTTLMQFVRTTLYGCPTERRTRYLPPVNGGRPGGALRVDGPHGSLEVLRHFDRPSTGSEGDLRIVAPDGTLHNDQLIASVCCGIDEPTFNQVFAVGLREIQELGSLDDIEAARLLYTLTTGTDRVSLAEVVKELASQRARLLADDSRSSQIAQLVAERERLRHELDQLRGQTRQYTDLFVERRKLDQQVAEDERLRDELDHTARLLQVAMMVRDRWQQRTDVLDQLSSLGDVTAGAVRALARYEKANSRVHDHNTRLSNVRRQRQRVRREAREITVHERLWRQAPRIAALVEQRGWIANLESEVQRTRDEVATLEGQLSVERKEFNLPSDRTDRGSKHTSAGAFKPLARAVKQTKQERDTAKAAAQQAREAVERLQGELRAALAGRQQSDLNLALERAGTLVNQLRRRVQLDDRLDQLGRQQEELVERTNDLVDRQVLPAWTLTAVGGVFVCGVVMVLAGLFLPGVGTAGWMMALIGLLGGGSAVAAKTLIEGSNARQLEASQKQLTIADQQINQATTEREQLDAQLPRGGGPLLTRLSTAEKELASLEELLPLEARRAAAVREVEASESLAEQANHQYRSARRRWQEALSRAGLPEDWTTDDIRRWYDRSGRIDDIVRQLQRARETLEQRQRELAGLTSRVDQLVVDAGLNLAETTVVGRIDVLERHLAEQDAREKQRAMLDQRLRELKRAERRHERAVKLWRGRRKSVLRTARATDLEHLRRMAENSARAQALRDRHATLSQEIAAALETVGTEDDLRPHFERLKLGQLETYSRDLTTRRQEVHVRLHSVIEQRGRLAEQLRMLESDRRPAERALELSAVEAKLHDAVERWQVLAVTERLMHVVRRRFERERQPATLREASHYLRALTEGRYTRVWTPIDGNVLRVDTADGKTLDVEVLSSGTREQLFLSLRLALAAGYHRRGAAMPMVLDDVLVNFDVERAEAAAKVLRDFAASGVQLLVFTCHEHIAKLFKTLDLSVRRLPSSARQAEPKAVEKAEVAPEPQRSIRIEPAAPKEESVSRSSRRRRRRKRMRRSEPFANTVWHEPVEDEIEIYDPDEDVDAA